MKEIVHITQADRDVVLNDRCRHVFLKRARIVAAMAAVDFTVETDRGVMKGVAGDWLVTNHPDDDPGSDLWTISAARMAATYQEIVDIDEDRDG